MISARTVFAFRALPVLLCCLAATPLLVAQVQHIAAPVSPDAERFIDALANNHAVRLLSPAAVAASLGNDRERIVTWVRANIRFEPYAGSLKGAKGTLHSAGGNAWDQALLLKEMLDAAGIPSRLARGRLSRADAEKLLQRMGPIPDREIEFWNADERAAFGITDERWQIAWKRASDFRSSMGDQFIEGARAYLDLFPPDAKPASHDDYLARLGEDYLWIQISGKQQFIEIHPCFPADRQPDPEPLAYAVSAASLPDDLKHWVRLRLWAQTEPNPQKNRELALEYRLLPYSLSRNSVSLFVLPENRELPTGHRLRFSLQSGDTILREATLPVSVDSSGFTSGIFGLWLETTLLAPNEAPRVETITLYEGIVIDKNWRQRTADTYPVARSVSYGELWRHLELWIGTSAEPWAVSMSAMQTMLRRTITASGKTPAPRLSDLEHLMNSDPVFETFGSMFEVVLKRLWPDKAPVIDGPIVLAALHRNCADGSGLLNESAYRVLFLRTAWTADMQGDRRLPGVLASVVLATAARWTHPGTNVIPGVDPQPVQTEAAGRPTLLLLPEEDATESLLQNSYQWGWETLAQLGYDRLRGKLTLVWPQSPQPYWWVLMPNGHDPIMRSKGGWSYVMNDRACLQPEGPVPGPIARLSSCAFLAPDSSLLDIVICGVLIRLEDGYRCGPLAIASEAWSGKAIWMLLDTP